MLRARSPSLSRQSFSRHASQASGLKPLPQGADQRLAASGPRRSGFSRDKRGKTVAPSTANGKRLALHTRHTEPQKQKNLHEGGLQNQMILAGERRLAGGRIGGAVGWRNAGWLAAGGILASAHTSRSNANHSHPFGLLHGVGLTRSRAGAAGKHASARDVAYSRPRVLRGCVTAPACASSAVRGSARAPPCLARSLRHA